MTKMYEYVIVINKIFTFYVKDHVRQRCRLKCNVTRCDYKIILAIHVQ